MAHFGAEYGIFAVSFEILLKLSKMVEFYNFERNCDFALCLQIDTAGLKVILVLFLFIGIVSTKLKAT